MNATETTKTNLDRLLDAVIATGADLDRLDAEYRAAAPDARRDVARRLHDALRAADAARAAHFRGMLYA